MAVKSVTKGGVLPVMFKERVEKSGNRVSLKYKRNGVYTDITWNELNDMVHKLSFYLMDLGVKKGDRVALFAENRYEWWMADMAVLSIGAISVPIYATNSPEEAHYIISNSESVICFVSTEDILNRVLKVKKQLPKLKKIVIFDSYDQTKAGVTPLSTALKEGAKSKNTAKTIDARLKTLKPNDMASIVYTSGTTGQPKGVMLSHDNFYSQVEILFGREFKGIILEEDVFLSFLPLSHVLERMAGYYGPIFSGSITAFADSVQTLLEDMKVIRPTILLSVPRIYEKLRAGILAKVADSSPIAKLFFKFAFSTAKKNLPYSCVGKQRKGLFAKRYNIANKVVFSKLKDGLGLDHLKIAVSGGGPLSISDAEFFIGMEIQILEGYGLTETSPVTHLNRFKNSKPGSVGHILPDTEMKLSDDGEILLKGRQLMLGYYKNPKGTSEVMTKDGFLRSGDIGRVDETGRLTITGRVKDIIITAGGKNISPQNIENSLKNSRFIEQAAVIGDRRKYLSALIVPNFDELGKWAKKNEIKFNSNRELIGDLKVNSMIGEEILKNMKHYARVEQIRNFKMLDADWSQETGELTPSLKVKRKVVEAKYAVEIESMYPPDKGD